MQVPEDASARRSDFYCGDSLRCDHIFAVSREVKYRPLSARNSSRFYELMIISYKIVCVFSRLTGACIFRDLYRPVKHVKCFDRHLASSLRHQLQLVALDRLALS